MKKSGERFIFRYVELKKTYEKKQQNKTKLKDCQVIFKRLSTVEKISFCKKIRGSLSQRNAACNETPRLSHLPRETLLEQGKLKQFTILDDWIVAFARLYGTAKHDRR